jgi:cephalosporin hydroxylase
MKEFRVEEFNNCYSAELSRAYYRAGAWNVKWLGVRIAKAPMDLWVYQELIVETKPDVVLELGTLEGGSALFFATVLDAIGHGRVISVDVQRFNAKWPMHPRIFYISADSNSDQAEAWVREEVKGKSVLVSADSDHHRDHVAGELRRYHDLVKPGGYLVVEDTNLNVTTDQIGYPGPGEAVTAFLAEHPEFEVVSHAERYGVTLNPSGFLRRKA